MTTLEKIVEELRRQYNEGGQQLGWFDYDGHDNLALIDGRVDLQALADAVDS